MVVLEKHTEINAAYIFGSIAKGTAKPDSDLDIVVQAHRPLTTEQHIALVEDLPLATGRAVDLIDLKTAGEPLPGQILQDQRILGGNAGHCRTYQSPPI